MAGIYPIPSTRTSSLLSQQRLISQLQLDQIDIQRLQTQISTGRRLTVPSDDSSAALRAVSIQRLLELKSQNKVNLTTSQSYLDATDTAVANVAQLLTSVRSTAQGAVGVTASDADRQAAVSEIHGAIEQLLSIGNEKFRDRYLFAGSRNGTRPFVSGNHVIRYDGSEGDLHSYTDVDLLTATNVAGSSIFGAFSSQVVGTADLNPITTRDTRLADLHGGEGVFRGRIAISDGTNTSIVDLTGAETLGDVADAIQAAPPTGRVLIAQVTTQGLDIDIDDAPGTNLTIREVSEGTTAADMGILTEFPAGQGPIVGTDLNPRLIATTRLTDISGERARAYLNPAGANNGIVLESRQRGTASNGVAIQYVDDSKLQAAPGLSAGNETVNYSQPAVAARASVPFSGFNNNLLLTATTAGTSLNNVEIRIANAGVIGNDAQVSYDSVGRVLTVGIDATGATQISQVINKINADGHFTATYDGSDPVDGGYSPTATITPSDAGVLTGNTSNSGGDAGTIFVHIQPGATTANHVVAALLANAQVTAEFDVNLDDSDTSSPAFAGVGYVDTATTTSASGGSGADFDQTSGLRITNGGTTYTVDLSPAETIEGVLNRINGSGAGVLAELNSDGTGINVRSRLSGTDLSIGENGGTTATQLGIRSFTLSTPLAELNHGRGVQGAAGTDFTIQRNDGTSFDVDIGTAQTIGDVLNTINNHPSNLSAATKVTARLATYGNGIELVDDDPVGTNQLQVQPTFGSDAAIDLGLVTRGSTVSAPPTPAIAATAGLSFGSPNTDIRLTANQAGTSYNGVQVIFADTLVGNVAVASYNGTLRQLTVNLSAGSTTASTIVSAIQSEGTFSASLDLTSDLTNDGSGIPGATGIAGTTAGGEAELLTGSDVNPQEVSGVFNSLLRLSDALTANDLPGIERALAMLDVDYDRINFARAEVGLRGQNLDVLRNRIADEENQLKDTLSKEIDTDFSAAVSELAGRQAALEASLRLAAQIHQLSLLNFL